MALDRPPGFTGCMRQINPTLRALSHPLRLQMLSLLWAAPMSAAELARELGISHALASDHLRRLDRAGLTELVEVRPRRGGRERRYQAIRGTPLSDQRAGTVLLAEALAQMMRTRAAERDPSQTGVTADAELWVPPPVWRDVRQRILTAITDLHDAAVSPRTPGTVRIGATVMAFAMLQPQTGEPATGDQHT